MKKSLLKWMAPLVGGLLFSQSAQASSFTQTEIDSLKTELPTLQFSEPYQSTAFEAYLKHYRLNLPNTVHYAGWFNGPTGKVFAHALKQNNSKGTVFLVHGYLVHSGIYSPLIKNFVEEGYSVFLIDLPGHGLSEGPRSEIKNFSLYVESFEGLLSEVTPFLPRPHHLVAHSTGAGMSLEFLLRHPHQRIFDKTVLLGPLVHSYLWNMSWLGYQMGSPFLKNLPRWLRHTSSDPDLLEFVKKDPLQHFATPVQWVGELIRWNEETLARYPMSPAEFLVLQGGKDTVVDWRYNLDFIKRKFPLSQAIVMPKADHDIFWEKEPLRNVVNTTINHYLSDSKDAVPSP